MPVPHANGYQDPNVHLRMVVQREREHMAEVNAVESVARRQARLLTWVEQHHALFSSRFGH